MVCFITIAALPACNISAKILTIALVIAKLKYLTFDPLSGVKEDSVKFDIAMIIYRHLAIMVYSEKFLNEIALMKYEDHHTKKLIQVYLHPYLHCLIIIYTKTRAITQVLRGRF